VQTVALTGFPGMAKANRFAPSLVGIALLASLNAFASFAALAIVHLKLSQDLFTSIGGSRENTNYVELLKL
jgi:hypothetical protein